MLAPPPAGGRRELGVDEISVVLAHLGAAHDVAVAAALSHTWRSVALPRLASEGALRPADGAIQILARSLKAKDPTFVACSPAASLVAIAEPSQHRIVICSLVTGEVVRTLGKFGWASGAAGGLNYPKGLAFDLSGEHLFVADRSNHRVVKMNAATGAVVAGVGSRGYGDGCFKYPQGVAFADTAAHGPLVFVCDYGNDRIVALEPTALEWRFCFGAEGSGSAAEAADEDEEAHVLQLPSGIAADATECFVVDGSAHEVHVFSTADGSRLRRLGQRGTWPGEFEFPWGVALWRPPGAGSGGAAERRLLVAEGAASGGRRGRLQVLDAADGAHVQTLVTPSASRLSGVCVDAEQARVCLVDHSAKAVRVLARWEAEDAGAASRPSEPSTSEAGKPVLDLDARRE